LRPFCFAPIADILAFARKQRIYTVNLMPHRRTKPTTGSRSATAPRRSFRQQYDELEARRAELCERLRLLGHKAEEHPAYKGALKLLNTIYRKERLTQRLAVLQSAAWLIDILEKMASTL
jgi:hypothetical protein